MKPAYLIATAGDEHTDVTHVVLLLNDTLAAGLNKMYLLLRGTQRTLAAMNLDGCCSFDAVCVCDSTPSFVNAGHLFVDCGGTWVAYDPAALPPSVPVNAPVSVNSPRLVIENDGFYWTASLNDECNTPVQTPYMLWGEFTQWTLGQDVFPFHDLETRKD